MAQNFIIIAATIAKPFVRRARAVKLPTDVVHKEVKDLPHEQLLDLYVRTRMQVYYFLRQLVVAVLGLLQL